MKKFVSLVLALSMLLSTVGIGTVSAVEIFDSGKCGDNLTWTLDDEGLLTISGTGAMYDYDMNYDMHAPWSWSVEKVQINSGVTRIGNYAFYNEDIESIHIPNSVTDIGEFAFSSTEVKNIDIPGSVKTIGERAFSNCTELENITIPGSVKNIEKGTFEFCISLKTVTLSNGIEYIAESAFMDCESLESITIPKSVVNIPGGPFDGCKNLSAITVDSQNKYYCSENGILYKKDKTQIISYPEGKKDSSYAIPDSVIKGVSQWIFSGCKNLTKINVSSANKSYSSIDGIVFNKDKTEILCYPVGKPDSLYDIPKGVASIRQAFANCKNLVNITLPDSVTSIARSSFSMCKKLESLSIPNGVTSLENGLFSLCSSLSYVILPKSVSKIGASVFQNCTSLADVYYSGSKEDWNNIEISTSGNKYLTNATIHFNSTGPDTEAPYQTPEIFDGEFHFASGSKSASYNYDDDYFAGTAYTYNHDLARMSLRLAMSAFATKNTETQYENVEDLLTQLDFKQLDYNDWYRKEPSTNSIAVAAGNKRIAYPDGDYTLIAVAIRGKGYKAEWGGNFNVGTGELHAGFMSARDQVLAFLREYVKEKEITGNVKIWITGYSRAAATTNLTAAYLNTHSLILSPSDATPEQIIQVKPENIYAYCFETPRGVVNPDNESGKYDNIFNIVNYDDFVPMIAMEKWDYDRYGITKYLPSYLTHSSGRYQPLLDSVKTNFKKYSGDEYVLNTFTYYYSFPWDKKDAIEQKLYVPGIFLQNAIDKLAITMENNVYYEEEFQEVLVWLMSELYGKGKTDEFLNNLLNEIDIIDWASLGLNSNSLFFGHSWSRPGAYYSLRATVKNVLNDTFESVNINISVNSDALDTLVELLLRLGLSNIETLCRNGAQIKQGHFPELCLAWLDTIEESDYSDKPIREFIADCPVDIEIYDSNNNLVASIKDDIPQEIEGSTIVSYVDENGQKIVYLPSDEEYSIKVTATDDGEVTYSVKETDLNTNEVKITTYGNMSVSKDDVIEGIAENLETTETASYEIKSGDIKVADAEVIENSMPFNVTVTAEGNGGASGGGSLHKGEFAQVVASPLENEEFLGWYNGDTLVSSDELYRFPVTESLTLTAKFTSNTCEVVFLDNEGYVISSQRILKGNKAKAPESPQKEGYTFKGFYKDEDLQYPINENDTYSEDTLIYGRFASLSGEVYFTKADKNVAIDSPVSYQNALVLVACYNSNNALISMNKRITNIDKGTTNITFNDLYLPHDSKIKVMVWNGFGIINPLFQSHELGK